MNHLNDLAVARILEVKSKHPLSSSGGFEPGRFYNVSSTPGLGGRLVKVGALIYRANAVAVAKDGMPLCIGDRICTGPTTFALLEFLIGGRVSVNANSETMVVNDRSMLDSKHPSFWKLYQQSRELNKLRLFPHEILPTGLVFAVRG